MLRDAVDEEDTVLPQSLATTRCRGNLRKSATLEEMEQRADDDMWIEDEQDTVACPIVDKDERPFRIMDLPTEIRLEIYRACLTRPYNIHLAKTERANKVLTLQESSIQFERHEQIPPSFWNRPTPEVRSNPVRRTRRRQASLPACLAGGSLGVQGGRNGLQRSPTLSSSSTASDDFATNPARTPGRRRSGAIRQSRTSRLDASAGARRVSTEDPLLVNLLRTNSVIYKEARSVLYSENVFTLDLSTAMGTLSCLHQRSRRQIKHVELEIPTFNEILERFQETVRLSLRYCSGLKKFVVNMPFTLPGADGSGTTGNTTVYANGFDILRWLPQDCEVVMKGNICTEIEAVVNKHLLLAKTLDKVRGENSTVCHRAGGLTYTEY